MLKIISLAFAGYLVFAAMAAHSVIDVTKHNTSVRAQLLAQ